MSSFYKMKRGWMDDPIFKKEPYTEREAFEWMIAAANWKPGTIRNGRGQLVDLARGQFSHSLSHMADEWKWTKAKANRFLKRLEKWEKIETTTEHGQQVVTICNYNKHQDNRNEGETETETQAKRKRNKEKKNKEVKEEKNISSYEDSPLDDAVEIFHRVCSGLPSIRKLTTPRKQKLRRRLKDDFGDDLRQWEGYCARIAASPFLMGVNDKGWTADLDWILEPRNLNRILEGKYDERPGAKQKTTDAYLAGFGAAAFEEQV